MKRTREQEQIVEARRKNGWTGIGSDNPAIVPVTIPHITALPYEDEHIHAYLKFNEYHPELKTHIQIGHWDKNGSRASNYWVDSEDPEVVYEALCGYADQWFLCRLCGRWEQRMWLDDICYDDDPAYRAMKHMGICTSCAFWANKVVKIQTVSPNRWYSSLIIGGWHFSCREPGIVNERSDYLGFGGRRYAIRNLKTGDTIQTNNLWGQGEIPTLFRDLLPDNAEFIKEQQS